MGRLARLGFAALLAMGLGACPGGDEGGSSDAGPSDGGPVAVLPPAEPATSLITPCPEGWSEVSSEGLAWCEPWPEGGAPSCGALEAALPGEAGCVTIGAPCPAGEFSEALPTDAPVVYVRAGATGGDGSLAAPFGIISESRALATAGSVVALGRGRYDEVVRLRAERTLWGACPAETELTASAPAEAAGTVHVEGVDAVVRDLRVADSERPGIYVAGEGRSVTLRGVVLSGNRHYAAYVAGGTLTAEEVVLRDTVPDAGTGLGGWGLGVTDGGMARLTRAQLVGNRTVGVAAFGPGVELSITGGAVVGTQGRPGDGRGGLGVLLEDGASAMLTDAVFEDDGEVGLSTEAGTDLVAEGVVVRDTRSAPDGTFGRAVNAEAGSFVSLRRSLFERNGGITLYSADPGTEMVVEDAIVRDTRSWSDGTFGRAAEVQIGGSLTLRRVRMSGNHELTVNAAEAGAVLLLEDVEVLGTLSRADGTGGRALQIWRGAEATVRRARFEDCGEIAIFVSDGGAGVLEDLVVRDTRPQEADGEAGRAFEVHFGATLDVHRALVERSTDIAAYVSGFDTIARFEDTAVRDIASRGCAETTCADAPFGVGIGAYDSAAVTVTHFHITRAALCGVHVGERGQLDLVDGRITESAIGACIQDPDYDVGRLSEEVRYLDNDVNLDAIFLPVPEPHEGVGG